MARAEEQAGGRGTRLANLGSAAVGLAELACLFLALAWLWRMASRPGAD